MYTERRKRMEQTQSSQQMGRVQLDIYMQKNKSKKEETFLKKKENLPTDLIPFTKINLKWITDLNVKSKIETQGKNLDDLGYGDDF